MDVLVQQEIRCMSSLRSGYLKALERSTENEDEYMISDNDPLFSKVFIIFEM